jgi:hypothetical protein
MWLLVGEGRSSTAQPHWGVFRKQGRVAVSGKWLRRLDPVLVGGVVRVADSARDTPAVWGLVVVLSGLLTDLCKLGLVRFRGSRSAVAHTSCTPASGCVRREPFVEFAFLAVESPVSRTPPALTK